MNVTYPVTYIRARTRPFKAYGKYQGRGSIEFSDDGIRISGRHVLAPGARWGIGLALFFGCLIIEAVFVAPGFILLFVAFGLLLIPTIMEGVWLKREDALVSYSDIVNYIAKPKQRFVAIDYKGAEWCTPVVLKSEKWSEIVASLRDAIPDRDASLTILPPSSKDAIAMSVFVFLNCYLYFSIIILTIESFIMARHDIWSIHQIGSDILRELVRITTFGLPLLISTLFAIKGYQLFLKHPPRRADGSEVPAAAHP